MALNKPNPAAISLPSSVVTVADLTRLRLETEKLGDFLSQAGLRQPAKSLTVPKVSRRLEETAERSGLSLLQPQACETLLKGLNSLNQTAPRIHLSFAAEPSEAFLGHLIDWFRLNIQADILLMVGLQPAIAAGFIMRTPTHAYDCSLRRHLDDKKYLLADALKIAQPGVAA